MPKKPPVPMRRITLEFPEDLIRRLKARASLEGVAPRDLVVAWIRSWATSDARRPGGRL
jgi:predicted DNA binding CopG/RHH family protein